MSRDARNFLLVLLGIVGVVLLASILSIMGGIISA